MSVSDILQRILATKRTEIAGKIVAATKEDPRYVVRSAKTGAETTRRRESLRPVDE